MPTESNRFQGRDSYIVRRSDELSFGRNLAPLLDHRGSKLAAGGAGTDQNDVYSLTRHFRP